MKLHSMRFEGTVLERGFWLYIWLVDSPGRRVIYVGRTGDSSSANASSPFRRIGQHLDNRPTAKGNALHRRLRAEQIDPHQCTFTMTAIGPLFPEQPDFERHKVFRDQTGALEYALAGWLSARGYDVLGVHHSSTDPDAELLSTIKGLLAPVFRPLERS